MFQRLWQLNQRLQRKLPLLPDKLTPESFKSVRVPHQSTDVGVREGALVEAALSLRDRTDRGIVRTAHRPGADSTIVERFQKRGYREHRGRIRPLVLGQSANLEVAVLNAPHQRGCEKVWPLSLLAFCSEFS